MSDNEVDGALFSSAWKRENPPQTMTLKDGEPFEVRIDVRAGVKIPPEILARVEEMGRSSGFFANRCGPYWGVPCKPGR